MKLSQKFVFAALALVIFSLSSINVAQAQNPDTGKPCTINGQPGKIGPAGDCRDPNNPTVAPNPVPGNGTSNTATIGGNGTYQGTCSQLQGVISAGGFVQKFLCPVNEQGTAIQVIIQNLANYILSLATFVFLVMLGLGFIQVMAGGSSPEAIKAGKRRITLAVSSIALFILGRLVLDLIGITGGKFLGVPVADGFDAGKINEIIHAVWNYILYFGGVFAVFMVMYGGFTMLTAAGNPQRIQTARRIITYAVIGLVGLAAAGLIYSLVTNALGVK